MTHSAGFSQPVRVGFIRRQWLPQRTSAQDKFDIFFGIVAPILCFKFDPIVFSGGAAGFQDGLLSGLQLPVYFISAVAIALLMVWMLFRRYLTSVAAPIGGALMAAGVLSGVIGVVILPFSLLGLMFVVGVFGFVPFIVSLVYIRAGLRALWEQDQNRVFKGRFVLAPLAAIALIALPGLVAVEVSRFVSQSIDNIVNGDGVVGMAQLKMMPILPEGALQRIATEYFAERDPAKRDRLRSYYRELSGEELERRLYLID
jgi:hypothetical protein